MKKATLLQIMTICVLLFTAITVQGQYQFPQCSPDYDPTQAHYVQGSEVSLNGINYRAKYWTTATPPDQSWETVGPCGDGGLGPDYPGQQRIIGYLPYWLSGYDITTEFDPSSVSHINLAFVLFQQNNNDFASADFASVAFAPFHQRRVDSLIVDCDVLNRAHQKGVTVSVAVGGATDFAFLWLMNKYYNNDTKMDEIATVIANYVTSRGLDGVDLDLECWWADANIAGTAEIGGRVRGDKWGGVDQGPHQAAIGLTKLSQKLREKLPTKLISAAVFATSWYGNNYDDKMANYLDWIGLMSYDFTGSWDKTAYGPHSALYKVPLGTYPGQTADNPIYSAQDALEYWMGLAPPAWNHDGGFNVPKAKLCVGVPAYGYDFSQKKPIGGNGYLGVPYKDIIRDYPNGATSYDAKDPHNIGGHISADGRDIYYNTPKGAAEKITYTENYGHQGVIVWEVSQDVPFSSPHSILKALKDAITTGPKPPVVAITAPANGSTHVINTALTITADASDPDGQVVKVDFYDGTTLLGTDTTAPYSYSFTPTVLGAKTLKAIATDNSASSTTSALVNITITDGQQFPPTASITSPVANSEFTEGTAITISADAADTDGQVVKVDFYDGTSLLGTDNTAPYAYTWNPIDNHYALKAIATDNDNLTGESTVVNIIVGGGSGCTAPAWEAGKVYVANDVVSHNGHEYGAKWWTTNEEPGSTGQWGVWEEQGACGAAVAAQTLMTDVVTTYPNPFDSQVTFSFTLTQRSRVIVTVNNSMGSSLATVVNAILNADSYSYIFDGSVLTTGVYVCNITIGNETTTQTIIKK